MDGPSRRAPAPRVAPSPCRGCRHYFVTWIADTPHGCRRFGFRSARLPSIDVERDSGAPCRAAEPRAPGSRPAQ